MRLELGRIMGPLDGSPQCSPQKGAQGCVVSGGQPGPRGAGLEWGRGVPATSPPNYARPALRPHRCLATAAAGNKGCLSGKGEGEGNRPQTRSHPPSFSPLRQWFPREGAGRSKAGARTWIRPFSAILSCDSTRSIPRGGAGSRRLPGCQR